MRVGLRKFRHRVACLVARLSGLGAVYETVVRPRGAVVLMYHSVAPKDLAGFVDPRNWMSPEQFESQMRFLSRHRNVISLADLVKGIREGETHDAGTVCITLDDGYLDNLTVAAPILEKYRLPATLYLATGYVSRVEAQWIDRLFWILKYRTSDKLDVEGMKGIDLSSGRGMRSARNFLQRQLLDADYSTRSSMLGFLETCLKPNSVLPKLTLSWDDVRELRRKYPLVEIGGHTRNHVNLGLQKAFPVADEVIGCADDIRAELHFEPEHFSFPYARWCDETRDIVRGANWKSAVGMGRGIRISAESDCFALPRIEAPQTLSEMAFMTSGAYPGALTLLGIKI